MRIAIHPVFNTLAFYGEIVENPLSSKIEVETAQEEIQKIIVECWLN